MPGITMELPINNENNLKNVLTGIQPSYTVAGTNDEVDELMIKNFLHTLADIALAIAARNEGLDQ